MRMEQATTLPVDPAVLAQALKLYPLKRSEHDLPLWFERQHELFLLLFGCITDGALVILPDGEISNINPAASSMLGLEAKECQGRQFLDVFCRSGGTSWHERIFGILLDKGEIRGLRIYIRPFQGERIVPVEVDISPLRVEGLLVRYLVILKDRTEYDKQRRIIRDQMRVLRESAMTDTLTGLCNRRWLYHAFGSYISRAQREEQDLCTIFIDLDLFKRINDEAGYQAGDEVLKGVATALQTNLRPNDAIVRLGGDEFLILMVMNRFESMAIAYRLLEAIRMVPVPTGSRNKSASNMVQNKDQYAELPSITASIGIFILDRTWYARFDPEKPWVLIREVVERAEAAKHNVKENGKNGIHLFSPSPPVVAPVLLPY
ncbi:MAG: diguanylate cyclase [Patescibacteria group bacterium]